MRIRNTISLLLSVALTACTAAERDASDALKLSAPPPDVALSELGQAGVHHRTIRVGQNEFDAYVGGPDDGELVVFLHGFPSSVAEWREPFASLSRAGYRVATWHQRGYSPGARPTDIASYAESALTQDVLDIATALGAERFHVVGHDWGAEVGWRTAAVAPERVLTLTAISTPHPDAYRAALSDPLSCQAVAGAYIGRLILPGYEYVLLANDARELRAIYEPLAPGQVEAHLRVVGTPAALGPALNWYRAAVLHPSPPVGPVPTPTTAIWGSDDRYICDDGWRRTPPFVTGPYEFVTLAGAGHWLPELNGADVTAAILARVRSTSDVPVNTATTSH